MPRRGAAAVEPEDMSLVELYRVHVDSAERAAAVSTYTEKAYNDWPVLKEKGGCLILYPTRCDF